MLRPTARRNTSRCLATAPSIMRVGWQRPRRPLFRGELSTKSPPDVITGYNWELYNVGSDPTESEDLATKDAGLAQGDAGPVLRRGQEARRAAARQFNARALEHAASE